MITGLVNTVRSITKNQSHGVGGEDTDLAQLIDIGTDLHERCVFSFPGQFGIPHFPYVAGFDQKIRKSLESHLQLRVGYFFLV